MIVLDGGGDWSSAILCSVLFSVVQLEPSGFRVESGGLEGAGGVGGPVGHRWGGRKRNERAVCCIEDPTMDQLSQSDV